MPERLARRGARVHSGRATEEATLPRVAAVGRRGGDVLLHEQVVMARADLHVLERLLRRPEFRSRFQRDPASTARAAGLDALADELELGDPMETLEPRESRSSLAGLLIAAAFEGIDAHGSGQHLLPAADDGVVSGTRAPQEHEGWAFIRTGASFAGNHPDYAKLRDFGAGGTLWDPEDVNAAAGIASAREAHFDAGIWLVPHPDESAQAFAHRAADAINRYHPDKVVLDIEAIGKGYQGSPGWRWSDEMMNTFSRLQPNPPPLAVTVEPLQDDFNYAAYTSRDAEVWPQAYLGDMTPRDPQEVIDRVVANGVPPDRVVPVLGPNQLDNYNAPHNLYTADDIQGRTPSADSPNTAGFRPAVTPEQVSADRAARAAERIAAPTASPLDPAPSSPVSVGQSAVDPDDLQGNLDDEDAGDDEQDGSDEDEPDEGGGSDDENEADEDEGGSDDDGSDDDQDAPGEGSNGEDANDDSSDGDSSDDESSDSSDSSESSDSGDSADGSDGDASDLPAADLAYPGDGAPREQLAAWMASAAEKRGLPPELPVMAALTESGLRNLNYGDADSVGFFQMRVSVWNQGAYSGYPSDPQKQLQWFLDRATEVKQQRVARGLAVDDPNQYGNWVADIENPAAQYRGRYQGHLGEARALLAQASPSKQQDGGQLAQAADVVDAAQAGPGALAAVAEARRYLGTPYQWGGSSPRTGFDCSGLVQWAYAKVGIRIPRVTDQQILASNGVPVSRKDLLPGDLVFFRDSTGYVHHVGISLGGDRFIHAPHTGDVVKISSLKESYYADEFTGGRRFVAPVAAAAERTPQVSAAQAAEHRAEADAVRIAQAALDEDAAAVRNPNTALFRALERQERGKGSPAG